jgi:hypothetical protein
MKATIDHQEAAELQQLFKDYLETASRALAALSPYDEATFVAVEAEQAAIVRRIKEIQGTTGQHWMA